MTENIEKKHSEAEESMWLGELRRIGNGPNGLSIDYIAGKLEQTIAGLRAELTAAQKRISNLTQENELKTEMLVEVKSELNNLHESNASRGDHS